MVAIAVLICLATLVFLFRLNRRKPQTRTDQFLIAFLGMLSVYEGIRLLKDAGAITIGVSSMFDDAIELLGASACLVAAVLLRFSRANHLEIESAMRLVRAAPPRTPRPDVPITQKDTSTLETLAWAVPKLSDGAFKLLAVLCMRSDLSSSGRVPVGVIDIQLKLGKSKEDLDRYLKELQDAGAVSLERYGSTINIEITGPAARSEPASVDPISHSSKLATEART